MKLISDNQKRKAINLYEKGLTIPEISRQSGMSTASVLVLMRRLGLSGKRKTGRKAGEKYGAPPWNKGISWNLMKGNKHAFIGDKAKKGTGQMRAYVKFKGVTTCNRCKVTPKSSFQMVRHHKDENTLNNKKSNVEFLCRKCHINHHREALLAARGLKIKNK